MKKLKDILLTLLTLAICSLCFGSCIYRDIKIMEAEETLREIHAIKQTNKHVDRLNTLLEKNYQDYVKRYTNRLYK